MLQLVICIGICFGAAGLGSLLTRPALPVWYAALAKLPWTPPNWLFGPVWTILFLMMAISAWLVWGKTGLTARPMQLFAVQLVLNVAWSGLFFGLRTPRAAFIEIVLLWATILVTAVTFRQIKTDRRMATLALFDLDWLCRNSQFFDLAAEFLNPPNGSLDTSRRMSFQSCARDVCNQGRSVSTFVTRVTAIGVRFLNPES